MAEWSMLCMQAELNLCVFIQPLHRSINHFFLSTSVWLCLSHVTFASKFTAKWQVEETLAGFECTWCARWCVVLDHLGSRTGQDNSQHLWRRKKRKESTWQVNGWSICLYCLPSGRNLKPSVRLYVLCTRCRWSLWCSLESVVQDVTGFLLTSSKAA